MEKTLTTLVLRFIFWFSLSRQEQAEPDELSRDFPSVYDGARGVHFIEKTVESSRSEKKWLDARWHAPVT